MILAAGCSNAIHAACAGDIDRAHLCHDALCSRRAHRQLPGHSGKTLACRATDQPYRLFACAGRSQLEDQRISAQATASSKGTKWAQETRARCPRDDLTARAATIELQHLTSRVWDLLLLPGACFPGAPAQVDMLILRRIVDDSATIWPSSACYLVMPGLRGYVPNTA